MSVGAKERIQAKVHMDPNSGCWLWTASLSWDGYPQIYHAGGMKRAHRVSYEVFVGPVPEGMQICHKCDTPSCVNPAHLFPGTQKENIDDCRRKDRLYKKLNNAANQSILQMLREGHTHKAIATAFSINPSMVSHIKKRAA
jgi:hypothetical protein